MADEQQQQTQNIILPTKEGLRATQVSRDVLRKLPTSARPVVDARDVVVPEGYAVEALLVGLSFPCGMGFADDGTLFLLEGAAPGQHAPICLPAS
jgi:hypothetical protein